MILSTDILPAGRAFDSGKLEMSDSLNFDALAAASPQTESIITSIFMVVFVAIVIFSLRNLIKLLPDLISCYTRKSSCLALEHNVQTSSDRNLAAFALLLPFCLTLRKVREIFSKLAQAGRIHGFAENGRIAAVFLLWTPSPVPIKLRRPTVPQLLRFTQAFLSSVNITPGLILMQPPYTQHGRQGIFCPWHYATACCRAVTVFSKVLFSSCFWRKNALTAFICAKAESASASAPCLYSPICTRSSISAYLAKMARKRCAAFLCSGVTMAFITRLTLAWMSMAG